jgi:Lambda phage tail tape-measure protein (Tape_meas_lam_C)
VALLPLKAGHKISIKLGSIQIDLLANTVSFTEGLTKASQLSLSSSRNIQRSLTLISTAATAMAASVIGSLTAVMAKAEDFAFTIQKAATITGTSSEMFSKLAYNAKLVGVPLDTVKGAMERLARTSGAAKSGNKEAIAAYGALGISLKDLNGPLKDSGDLTVAIAKKLDVYKDSTNKTALEQKLFGRSGAELAPLLKQIATGFDTASKQATLFGVVIGDKTAAQAKQLHQSMMELESVALGFSLRLLSGVSPALEDVSGKILKFVTSADGMKTVDKVAGDVSKVVEGLGTAFVFLGRHAGTVKAILEGLAVVKLGSIFLPMIAGAAKAGTGVGDIGKAAAMLIGRASGISGLGRVFDPLVKGAFTGETSLLKMYRAFGFVETGGYAAAAASDAFKASLLSNPYLLVGAGLLSIGIGFYKIADAAKQSEIDGGKWADVWNAGTLGMKENINDVVKTLDLLTGRFADFAARDYKFTPFQGLVQQAGRDRRGMSDKEYGFLHAAPLELPATKKPDPKLDAPIIPKAASDKVDHLKLKMDELAGAAKVAHDALMNAGKGVDFERADAIAKEYTKTVIELTDVLKAQHKTLTDADKAAILSSITTRINDDSQAKFRDEVANGTEQILAQANATDILTKAMGQSAAAIRKSQVDAEFATKYASSSPEWMKANQALIEQQKAARTNELAAGDNSRNTATLDSLKQQVHIQLLLNAAILAGRDAMNQARLAGEQETIRKSYADRGDNNKTALDAELAQNEKLFKIKNTEADLNRAAAMDAARTYNDEISSINAAAAAAKNAGQAISQMQIQAADKAAWDSYLESIDKTTLAVGDASQGVSAFFREMGRETQSAAQQVHDVLGSAFQSLNQTIEKLISGQKASFSQLFRSISEQLAKLGLQKAEQGVAKSITNRLGQGDPQNPSKGGVTGLISGILGGGKSATNPTVTAVNTSNMFLSQILATLRMGTGGLGASGSGDDDSGATGADGSPIGGLTGAFTSSSGSSLLTDLTKGITSFGGHYATGGDVTAGVSYDVGEMGREKFTPTQNGKITPNKDLGGYTYAPVIDARGSNDPAQTEAAVHRAMRQYAPGIVAASAKSQHEMKMRRPSRAG